MKKTDIKSLVIGFLAATCLFLFMGLTEVTGKFGGVIKVEVVNSSFPKSLDVNIKDFPSYDKIRVDVTDMP